MKSLCKYMPILVLAIALGGCGIKPKNLDAPEGSDPKKFPQTYPAPGSSQ